MSGKNRADGTLVVALNYRKVSAVVTRPANTTQYAAGDVVTGGTPAVLTFSGCAQPDVNGDNSGEAIIRSAINVHSSYVATGPDLELYLFSIAPTIDADNAAWTPTDAELLTLVGVIPFTTWKVGTATVGADGNQIDYESDINLLFKCAAGDQALYGILVERGTYIPVSDETFTIALHIEG